MPKQVDCSILTNQSKRQLRCIATNVTSHKHATHLLQKITIQVTLDCYVFTHFNKYL